MRKNSNIQALIWMLAQSDISRSLVFHSGKYISQVKVPKEIAQRTAAELKAKAQAKRIRKNQKRLETWQGVR